MIDVIIALIPTLIAACVIFGLRALLVTVFCAGTCVLTEYVFRRIAKRDNTISDCSAAVTGIILALNLPVGIPLQMAFFGCIVAIAVVKQLFGGLGQNFVNPAITARVVMLISFPKVMTAWVTPAMAKAVDGVSGATPLALLKAGDTASLPSTSDLFFGLHGGSMGEVCAAALLLGFVYLLIRKVITPTTPLCFMATVAVMALLSGQDPLVHLLTGGVMLGAIFMATDYATTPATETGRAVFGIGCGVLTMGIRLLGTLPEGVSFAILFMNILTPHIDTLTRTKPFGGVKREAAV